MKAQIFAFAFALAVTSSAASSASGQPTLVAPGECPPFSIPHETEESAEIVKIYCSPFGMAVYHGPGHALKVYELKLNEDMLGEEAARAMTYHYPPLFIGEIRDDTRRPVFMPINQISVVHRPGATGTSVSYGRGDFLATIVRIEAPTEGVAHLWETSLAKWMEEFETEREALLERYVSRYEAERHEREARAQAEEEKMRHLQAGTLVVLPSLFE